MRPTWRVLLIVLLLGLMGLVFFGVEGLQGTSRRGYVKVPGAEGRLKSAAEVRAERRAFDGAPPVIPHEAFGDCTSCHTALGLEVPGVGFAPPSPHEQTAGMSPMSRCEQCHVFQQAVEPFVDNTFAGLRQDLRRGQRLYEEAPPVIPHQVFMREHCVACHTGPAARESIRSTHPERVRCLQCHAPQITDQEFAQADHRIE